MINLLKITLLLVVIKSFQEGIKKHVAISLLGINAKKEGEILSKKKSSPKRPNLLTTELILKLPIDILNLFCLSWDSIEKSALHNVIYVRI